MLLRRRCFCSLVESRALSTDLISSKCDYVKALYGYGGASASPATSFECRIRQAATVALQNYLHFRRGVPLDDAVFISSGAPRYLENIVQRMKMGMVTTNNNYEQVRSKAECLMQKEGVDELEPFLESIGVDQQEAGLFLSDLCGDRGLLRTAKVLDSRGIPKKAFWSLLRHNTQLLNYSLRDCLDALGILHSMGLPMDKMGEAVCNCPAAFRVELEEEMRPVLEQLHRLGLDRNVIGRIILEAPSKLESLRQVNMESVVTGIIEHAGISKEEAATVVREDPVVLVGTSISKLMQLVTYLKTVLLLEEDEVASLVTRFPRLLVLSLEKSVMSKVDYLKKLGVERVYIKTILLKTPQVLVYNLEDNLKPKMDFLESIGFKRKSLAALLARCPSLLNDIVSNCLRRKANFLLHHGVQASRLADLFYTYPQFVGLRLDEVKPRVEFYRQLKVDYQSLGNMIAKHPALLGYDLEKRVKPMLDYLKHSLGFGSLQMVQFLRERPSVLGESVALVEEKVSYFEKLGFRKGSDAFNEILAFGLAVPPSFIDARLERLRNLGITEPQLKKLIEVRLPLLYRDDQRMLATTEYLLKDMKLPVDFLLKFPQLFGYCLEERVKPRHRLIAFLKAKHVVKADYPAAYLHLSRYKFEEMFLDCHPQARHVYSGRLKHDRVAGPPKLLLQV